MIKHQEYRFLHRYRAIEDNLTELMLFLLDSGFDEAMYEIGAYGDSRTFYILEELAKRNNVEMMRILLEAGYKEGLNRPSDDYSIRPVLLMAVQPSFVIAFTSAPASINTCAVSI